MLFTWSISCCFFFLERRLMIFYFCGLKTMQWFWIDIQMCILPPPALQMCFWNHWSYYSVTTIQVLQTAYRTLTSSLSTLLNLFQTSDLQKALSEWNADRCRLFFAPMLSSPNLTLTPLLVFEFWWLYHQSTVHTRQQATRAGRRE